MADSRTLHITLRLNDIDELFKPPEITPFSQNYQIHSYTAGVEYIADTLYAHTSYSSVHATISLPVGVTKPDESAPRPRCNATVGRAFRM